MEEPSLDRVDPGGEGSILMRGEGLELVEATDDLQAGGEVLGHGLHFQVEG